jgi:hypothetical protein
MEKITPIFRFTEEASDHSPVYRTIVDRQNMQLWWTPLTTSAITNGTTIARHSLLLFFSFVGFSHDLFL